MAWPNVSEYQDAVLNSKLNFDEPELKAGEPELDGQGFPRPRTGQFACVFRIASGQRDWAVKCFTQEVKDLQERYAAIDEYISPLKLPYMVDFDYLPKGIRVGGQWYPILKMEWVKGELLSQYIEHHLSHSIDLQQLALRWIEMIKTLQSNSIAHGDLQERNVLVVNGQLKLVDYDGMFVPALSGRPSHEIGHRNYQHPQRTDKDFDPFLDNFSAWVIYTSLVALSIDQTLWSRTKAGDECLLFRKSDFDQPLLSSTLALLERHPNPNIRTLATLFRSMLFFAPQQVPSLDGQVPSIIQSPAPNVISEVNWWSTHAPIGEQTAANDIATTGTYSTASWIIDFISPAKFPTRVFTQSMVMPRLAAFLSGNSLVLVFGLGLSLPILFPVTFPANYFYSIRSLLILFLLTLVTFCINGIILIWYYLREPIVIEKGTYSARVKEANKQFKQLELALDNSAKKEANLHDEENQEKRKLNETLARLRDQEKREVEELNVVLGRTLASIEARRRNLEKEEKSALAKLNSDIGSKLQSLTKQIVALASTESNEITKELTTIQNQHIENILKSHRINEAPMRGLRYTSRTNLEQALFRNGIYTAYDISWARVDAVYGFGPKRTQALVSWRNQLEQQARFTMPRDLDPRAKNAISSKYATQSSVLESQRYVQQLNYSAEEATIRERHKAQKHLLDDESAKAKTQSTQRIQEVNKRYALEYVTPTQALDKLAKDFTEKYHQIDEHTQELRQQMFGASWQVAKINHEYESYRNASFSRYLKTVFLGQRASYQGEP